MHEAGVDLERYMDTANARRPGREIQRVNVDFPIDLLNAIDHEAARIGVTRQAFIKLRLADSLPTRFASRRDRNTAIDDALAKNREARERLARPIEKS